MMSPKKILLFTIKKWRKQIFFLEGEMEFDSSPWKVDGQCFYFILPPLDSSLSVSLSLKLEYPHRKLAICSVPKEETHSDAQLVKQSGDVENFGLFGHTFLYIGKMGH